MRACECMLGPPCVCLKVQLSRSQTHFTHNNFSLLHHSCPVLFLSTQMDKQLGRHMQLGSARGLSATHPDSMKRHCSFRVSCVSERSDAGILSSVSLVCARFMSAKPKENVRELTCVLCFFRLVRRSCCDLCIVLCCEMSVPLPV